MTIKERVKSIVNHDYEGDPFGLLSKDQASTEKMILMAYHIGREKAVREVADMYSEHIKKQRKRANSCRYYQLANYVIGPEKYLYHIDYARDMTSTFGDDPADI